MNSHLHPVILEKNIRLHEKTAESVSTVKTKVLTQMLQGPEVLHIYVMEHSLSH